MYSLQAYIGGLYYEQGQVTARAKKWIKHLLSPHVTEAHAALSTPRFFTPNVTENTPATGKHASPTASPVRTSSKRPRSSTQQLDEAVHCIAQFVKDAVDQKAEKENTMSADLQKLLDRVPNEGKSVRWSTVLGTLCYIHECFRCSPNNLVPHIKLILNRNPSGLPWYAWTMLFSAEELGPPSKQRKTRQLDRHLSRMYGR